MEAGVVLVPLLCTCIDHEPELRLHTWYCEAASVGDPLKGTMILIIIIF